MNVDSLNNKPLNYLTKSDKDVPFWKQYETTISFQVDTKKEEFILSPISFSQQQKKLIPSLECFAYLCSSNLSITWSLSTGRKAVTSSKGYW